MSYRIGLDLSNTRWGVAIIRGDGSTRPELVMLTSVIARGSGDFRATAAAVARKVGFADEFPPKRDVMSILHAPVTIERPPPTARDGAHGGAKQAEIGFTLGLLIGATAERLSAAGHLVELADVSSWRASMLLWSTRWGVLAEEPTRAPLTAVALQETSRGMVQGSRIERKRDGLEVVWSGCGHRTAVSFGGISSFPHRRCPTCSEIPLRRPGTDDKEWKRQAWKALACTLVGRHWPAEYSTLLYQARSAARVSHQDHEFAGVADACEAVWIAVHGLTRAGVTA